MHSTSDGILYAVDCDARLTYCQFLHQLRKVVDRMLENFVF